MRYLVFFLGFGLFFSSCGGNEESNNDNAEEVDNSEILDTSEVNDDEYYIPEEPIVRDYKIEEFPKEWVKLEKDDDGTFFLLDHWESQKQGFEIYKDEQGEWGIDIMMAQDSDFGKVKNFVAQLTEGEGIYDVEGSFDIESTMYGPDRHVEFLWESMRYYAEFKELGLNSDYFVSKNQEDFFPVEVVEREEDY